jgi:hypothetical protein
MEVFGIIGMSMGTMGFIFGITGMNQVTQLRKEHEDLKGKLKESGVLKEKSEPGQDAEVKA